MRTTTLPLLFLALCSFATAQDTFTQKPAVAPAVERGDLPKGPVIQSTAEFWAVRFDAGPVPLWIWGATPTKNYFLRTEFAAAGVKAAKIRVSADNHVSLYFNGKQVAASDEWKDGAEADVTALIKEKNEIVAEVKNDGGVAGFVFQLVTTDEQGKTKHVVSDETWLASEKKGGEGVKAKRIGTYGDAPWGKVFEPATQPGSKVPANTFVTLPGFKVEKLFTVPQKTLGSWVNLTADAKGRLIASDQGGLGLVRITPGKVGTDEETKVERIPAKITAAQGLLWHKDALYVVCNGGPGSGLYRVTSSKKDDVLDKVEKLKAINGGGEHGPHAVRLAPDGKSLYVICGNHTQPPAELRPQPRAEELGRRPPAAAALGSERPRPRHPRAGRVRRQDRLRRQDVGDLQQRLPQPVRLRVQRRRRDVRLRRGHGVRLRDAVVPPDAGEPRDQRQRTRLAHRAAASGPRTTSIASPR